MSAPCITDDLLCEGSEFSYYDHDWSIWVCSLCDRPLAVQS